MKCNNETTMQALGKVLSTPTGAFLMHMYNDATTWENRAGFALEEVTGKRPTKKQIEWERHKSQYHGEHIAYRNALIAMVIDASGYKVTRRDAIRAINDEDEQMCEGCHLSPIGTVRMTSVSNDLASVFYA